MIATLDDILENLADQLGIYGAHTQERQERFGDDCQCRVCWTSATRARILSAIDVEHKLGTL